MQVFKFLNPTYISWSFQFIVFFCSSNIFFLFLKWNYNSICFALASYFVVNIPLQCNLYMTSYLLKKLVDAFNMANHHKEISRRKIHDLKTRRNVRPNFSEPQPNFSWISMLFFWEASRFSSSVSKVLVWNCNLSCSFTFGDDRTKGC